MQRERHAQPAVSWTGRRRVVVAHTDAAIVRRLTADGFRSARSAGVPKQLVANLRRAQGQESLTEQFRHQEQIDGSWTVWGLARTLGVHRNWLYERIRNGTLQFSRHPTTGHYLIPDNDTLLAQLRAQRRR